jgi:hypothetical protein
MLTVPQAVAAELDDLAGHAARLRELTPTASPYDAAALLLDLQKTNAALEDACQAMGRTAAAHVPLPAPGSSASEPAADKATNGAIRGRRQL